MYLFHHIGPTCIVMLLIMIRIILMHIILFQKLFHGPCCISRYSIRILAVLLVASCSFQNKITRFFLLWY